MLFRSRGGTPTSQDRIMATRMGYWAVKCIEDGKSKRIVVFDKNKITDIDIEEGLSKSKTLNENLLEAQLTVAI